MEIIHLNQTPSLDLYLDLHACFDLMVKACHNLACYQHRTDEAYHCLHACMHCLMQCDVRHKFGVSTKYNTFEQHPWHGTGTGVADAVLQYIVLFDTMIDAYHSKIAPCMIMTQPSSLLSCKVLRPSSTT